jgi:hypothetical protein
MRIYIASRSQEARQLAQSTSGVGKVVDELTTTP